MGSAARSSRTRRVLLVEDDADIQEAIIGVLGDEGYVVDVAGNGQEALSRLQRADAMPDVILLDLGMPVMDGRTFREAQRNTPGASVPVVIMTGSVDAREASVALSAAAYLTKPMSLGDLLATVGRVCA